MSRALAIIARDVQMTYRDGAASTPALRGVSLEMDAGEFLLLMGPSGSGKTTLLSILGGILTPTSGEVVALGTRLGSLNPSALARFRLANLGFVFQGFNLFGALTARENVSLALSLKGEHNSKVRAQADGLLGEVGLREKADSTPAQLSAGEKQRVAIARALACAPRIIMADEPTASLDSENGKAVTDLLRALAKSRNAAVLTVTHDPRIVDVADRIVYLEDGMLKDSPAAAH
jgi:putative ABC transport system ATP-binding protein